MNRFSVKIILPSILAILLFILTIFLVIIPRFQNSILNGKREMIKELTNSAVSILTKYENDEKQGLLTREEAQKTAISRIQYLRYGEENKDYFWITDMHPNMIMHPYRPDLNGTDLTDFADPHGKKLFVVCVETVQKSDHGYVDYMWQWKDDPLHIVPKLSYVSEFKPWGWVIGTGVYIEDVKKETVLITKRLVWISIGISFLVALLLLFISQQSFKIERKRIEAEDKLHRSKQKYKTLVEATTEGLIMLIDGKISYSNKVIHKMTGFDHTELLHASLHLLLSEHNSKSKIEALLQNEIKEGKYELNLNKKNGGFVEVILTTSEAVFNNSLVDIIIVKDVTLERKTEGANLDYQKLLATIDIGFFRAEIEPNGKVIFANETVVNILGYSHFKELAEQRIFELLWNYNERRDLIRELLQNGFVKNKIINIKKKDGAFAFVSITLVMFTNEANGNLICDGIIEDITTSELKKLLLNDLVTSLKTSHFLQEQSIQEWVSPIDFMDSNAGIQDVLNHFISNKTDVVLLSQNASFPLGIITKNDIQNRVLALDLKLDNPAYLIMSAPIYFINSQATVHDTLSLFEKYAVNHLVVKNENSEIVGEVSARTILEAHKKSLSFLIENVKKAKNKEDLKRQYDQMVLLVKPLIKSDLSVNHITSITSTISDAITQKIIELAIEKLDVPPVSFAFIGMGSEGRKEETLYTDQDNAIIYEDVTMEHEVVVQDYFLQLATQINQTLGFVGFSFCKGNIMAMNPVWCKPFSDWERYFAQWIATPDAKNLLDANIFFDFRTLYGDIGFEEKLKTTILTMKKKHPLFLYHMAYNTFQIKTPQFSSGGIISEKDTGFIDLKSATNLLIMIARTYALAHDIDATNTLERLEILKRQKVLSESMVDEMVYSYNFLVKKRYQIQVVLIEEKLPLSNILETKKLIEMELMLLKKILSTLPTYQNKISTDFRLSI